MSRPGERRPLGRAVAMLALATLLACSGELTSPAEPLRLLASSLPAAYLNEPLDVPLRPTGGLRPYAFTVVDGALPPGVTVEGGRLRGAPTAEGRFAFTIEVSDANLSRTVQRFELLVRPLPVPVLRIDAPTTDVRAAAALRLRLEEARGWRGAKVEIVWDDDAFELDAETVAPSRATLAAFWEHEPGRLRVDLAALGEALDGEHELLRFSLVPREPGPLRLEIVAEHRYVGGHHYARRGEGAPAAPPAEDVGPGPGEDGAEGILGPGSPDAGPGADADEDDAEEEEP